jgi:hypothetical protein
MKTFGTKKTQQYQLKSFHSEVSLLESEQENLSSTKYNVVKNSPKRSRKRFTTLEAVDFPKVTRQRVSPLKSVEALSTSIHRLKPNQR